jgi:hypothetical protein
MDLPMTAPASPSAPVAWRWRFDAEGQWHYGGKKPGGFRFGDPEEVKPLYASPAPSMVGLREKVMEIFQAATGDNGCYLTLAEADAILALLAREGVTDA